MVDRTWMTRACEKFGTAPSEEDPVSYDFYTTLEVEEALSPGRKLMHRKPTLLQGAVA